MTKPCAPAYRTWFSITSWIAAVDVAALLARAACRRRRRRRRQRADAVDGAVQRLAHERRASARAPTSREPAAPAACRSMPLDAHAADPTSAPRRPDPTGRPATVGRVPVEPPPSPWALRRPARRRPARRPGRDRRRPGAGHAAGGLPARALPDAVGHGRATRWTGSARCAAACCRWTGCVVSRSLRRSVRDFEIRVDTAFDEVVDACADPRRPSRAGSTTTSARRTCGCTSWAGRTRSRRGATAGSSAGCTAWRSAGCSRASRCSTGSATPRRSRWSGWCELLRDEHAGEPAARRAVGDPHLASLGVVERRAATYLRRLDQVSGGSVCRPPWTAADYLRRPERVARSR